MEWLAEHRPDLVERYDELYRRGAYMPPEERRRLAQMLQGPSQSPRERAKRQWRPDPSAADISAFRRGDQQRSGAAAPEPRVPEPLQQSLF